MSVKEEPVDGADVAAYFNVHRLLVGVVETGQLQPRTVYLEKGSEEEATAYAALAEFLRRDKPIPTSIRLMLADLFDPAPQQDTSRKLVLQNPRGRKSDVFRNRIIAETIFEQHVGQGAVVEISKVLLQLSDVFAMDFKSIERLWYQKRQEIAAMKGCPDIFNGD